ncbi:MAG: cyclic nucleotide-binding and patatin-like phospholipase domain-containing protein [Actinomycetota bacterium]
MRPVELPRRDVEDFLAASSLFGGLDRDAIRALAEHLDPVAVRAGEVVVAEGDPAEALYLVHAGRLLVRRSSPELGPTGDLSEIGVGETVGELALVTDRPRSASAIARRDSRLLRLSVGGFEALVSRHPQALRVLTTQVVDHLERPRPIGKGLSVLALVPLHGGERVARAMDDLVLEIRAAAGRVGVLRRGNVRDDEHAAVHRLEQIYDLVLMVADHADEGWTDSCADQADRVVLVADAAGDPAAAPVERRRAARPSAIGARTELVLAHPPATEEPRGTARWLAGRSVQRHHHLRVGDRRHAGRVARLLTDTATGLVCSGGGARALSEIGSIEVLLDGGLEIDAVTGTSAGALVGGAFARDWPVDRVVRTLRRHLVDEGRPVEPTIPLVALSSGARMTARLREVCDELAVEDQWIDFACLSTDLSERRPHVHRTGPAWRALRSSMSIPGLFPPVASDGNLLIDGGVVDNLPVAAMTERHPGIRTVAIDVGVHRDLEAGDLPADTVVQGLDILRARLHPRRRTPSMAGIASVLARLAELGNRHDDAPSAVDLMIRPEVGEVSLLDFASFDVLLEAGRGAAREALVATEPDTGG